MKRFFKTCRWLMLPTILGCALSYFGVTFVGLLAVFFIEHRFFGFPLHLAMFIEDLFAWIPVSLLFGGIAGYFSQKRPVLAGLATAVVPILVLTIDLARIENLTLNVNELFGTLIFLLKSSGPLMLLFTPLGAYLGVRLRQRRTSQDADLVTLSRTPFHSVFARLGRRLRACGGKGWF